MRKLALIFAITFVLVSACTMSAQVPIPAVPAGTISRGASEYRFWDETEGEATPIGGAVKLYSRSLAVPAAPGYNVFYVTMHTTGDTGGGQGSFECLIDNNPCIPNAKNITTGNDYVALLTNPGPNLLTDNAITYSWCGPITSGAHTFTINMVAAIATVSVEAFRVDIDVAKVPQAVACTKAQ
jgi:hypothetical protein